MHPDLSSTPLMDTDDLHMLLDWLIEHLETEPDSADPFAKMEREGYLRHQTLVHGIDYEEANDRLHQFIMRSRMHCFSAVASQADAQALPLLLPKLVLLLWYTEHFYVNPTEEARLADTLERLLTRGPIPPQAARWLCEVDSATYRALLAGALTSGQPHEIKLLRTLLNDKSAKVRNRAAEALAASGAVSWWEGFFAADPSAYLTEDAHDDAARAWMEAVRNVTRHKPLSADMIAASLGALPPLAQREALRLFLRDPALAEQNSAALSPILCATPDAHTVLYELPSRWAQKHTFCSDGLLGALAHSASPQTRRALWELIYQELPTAAGDYRGQYYLKCKFLMAAWPADVPYTALFDRFQTPPPGGHDFIADNLWDALVSALATHPDPERWPDLEARLSASAYAAPRAIARSDVHKLAAVAPPDVRARIENAWLASDSTSHIAAALATRLNNAGLSADEVDALLWTCWEDARLRAGLLSSHALVQAHTPWLRARFADPDADASLSLDEIARILMNANRLTGPPPDSRTHFQSQLIGGLFLLKNTEKYDRILPHPAPFTDIEWARARSARARTPRTCSSDWMNALTILPAQPHLWDASDLAIFDEAWTRYSEGDQHVEILTLSSALFALRPPDVLERFVFLLERNQTAPSFLHECLLNYMYELARVLGVPLPPLPKLTPSDY